MEPNGWRPNRAGGRDRGPPATALPVVGRTEGREAVPTQVTVIVGMDTPVLGGPPLKDAET